MSDHTAAAARNMPSPADPADSVVDADTPDAARTPRLAAVGTKAASHGQEIISAVARGVSPAVPETVSTRSMRFWLVRASFGLFSVVTILLTVFTALGLLSLAEAAMALSPVLTVTALLIGVVVGDRTP